MPGELPPSDNMEEKTFWDSHFDTTSELTEEIPRSTIPQFPDIPAEHSGVRQLPDRTAACCCGRSDCVYLRHNNEALGNLERDVIMAGRMGQVCGVVFIHSE